MLIKTIKIKEGFILRELGGEFCLADVGEFLAKLINGKVVTYTKLNLKGVFL